MTDIKVGDLAVVVKWPCCGIRIGAMLRVTDIEACIDANRCTNCGTYHPYVCFVACDGKKRAPMEWLKRIPPISELEGVIESEEITA